MAAAKLSTVNDSTCDPDGFARAFRLMSLNRSQQFVDWYKQLVELSGMVEGYDVSGCYVLLPWSFSMWEYVENYFIFEVEKLGFKPSSFPLFLSSSSFSKFGGSSAQAAWVTKSGESDMKFPIRQTNEPTLYPFLAKAIRSHRHLPWKVYQDNTVVRVESDYVPFVRSLEIHQLEGYGAYATVSQAKEDVSALLDLHKRVYEELLAVPVIRGKKISAGKSVATVEAVVAGGLVIEGAHSSLLEQHFARTYGIQYEDDKKQLQYVWQNSWTLSFRCLGVMAMVHSDDKGLILPPRVAPAQVVIFSDEQSTGARMAFELKKRGLRVETDTRKYAAADKHSFWELKGVPLRVEISGQKACIVRRDSSSKQANVALDQLAERVTELLEDIQASLLKKATRERNECIVKTWTNEQFKKALKDHKLALAPCSEGTEAAGVEGAELLFISLEEAPIPEGTMCVLSGKPATSWAVWGRRF